MARMQMDTQAASIGGAPDADTLYQLGLRHAVAMTPQDRMAAHKWFNLAARRGSADAIRMRQEIAAEMSAEEIAAAQRAARDWITRH